MKTLRGGVKIEKNRRQDLGLHVVRAISHVALFFLCLLRGLSDRVVWLETAGAAKVTE